MTGQEKGEEAGGCGCLRIDIPGGGGVVVESRSDPFVIISFAGVALECGAWSGHVASWPMSAPLLTDVIGGLTGRIKGEGANRVLFDIGSKHLHRMSAVVVSGCYTHVHTVWRYSKGVEKLLVSLSADVAADGSARTDIFQQRRRPAMG